MLNFRLSQLNGIWSGITDIFAGIWNLIGIIFYYVFVCGIGRIADICQLLFRKFAGISNNNVENEDLIFSLLRSSVVKNLFFALLLLAIFLLLVTTFVAVIKTEFAKDGNNNKKKAIKGAFRGLVNFVIVPLVCFFGLFVGNIFLRALDGATSGGNNVLLSHQVFMAGAYNANRARLSENNGDENNPYISGSFGRLLVGTDGNDGRDGYGNFGVFLDDKTGSNKLRAAEKIDNYFINGYTIVVNHKTINSTEYGEASSSNSGNALETSTSANTLAFSETDFYHDGKSIGGIFVDYENNSGWTHISLANNRITFAEGDKVSFSIYNTGLVFYYYDLTLTSFNYLIETIAMCFCAWTLLVTILGLIKRLFMLATLFIISPPICALYPLDDGKALGEWRKVFVKETLSSYSVVVVLNIFMSLLAVISTWTLFAPNELGIITGFANYLARVLIIIAGLGFFKEATKTIAGIIGGGDAYGDGAGATKAFTKNLTRAAAGAALAGGLALGGAKVAGKAMGNAMGVAGKPIRNAFNKSKEKDDAYAQAHQDAYNNQEVEGKAVDTNTKVESDANSMNKSESKTGSNAEKTTGKAENAKTAKDGSSNAMNSGSAKSLAKQVHFDRKKSEYIDKMNNKFKAIEEDKSLSEEERKAKLAKAHNDYDKKMSNKFSDENRKVAERKDAKMDYNNARNELSRARTEASTTGYNARRGWGFIKNISSSVKSIIQGESKDKKPLISKAWNSSKFTPKSKEQIEKEKKAKANVKQAKANLKRTSEELDKKNNGN